MDTLAPRTIQDRTWRAFTPGTEEREAREVYAQREGTQPATVGVNQFGQVLAGPVEETR